MINQYFIDDEFYNFCYQSIMCSKMKNDFLNK